MATRELFALPTLFKKASTGKDLQWRIWVEDDTIYEEYGQIGGKLQTTPGTKCKGKNAGKANATTDDEQAQAEARSKWEKKLKGHNYTETLKDAQAGKSSSLVEGGILPMLAHKFSEHGDKLVYPCAVQPKLDGHRCMGMPTGLWSRTRKIITGVPHIAEEVSDVLENEDNGSGLDGELYNHAYHDKFEKLTHFIRQEEATPGSEIVQYHVYDIAMPGTFTERWEYLTDFFNLPVGRKHIKLVETRIVNDEEELMLAFEDFLAQGYEGAIARNLDGLYVNKRSKDLLKIKQFDDGEFTIVGVTEGKGKLAGHGIFICTTKAGTPDFGVVTPEQAEAIVKANPGVFVAKMKGETSELKKYIIDYPAYRGRLLTVKYQGLTNKNKVPRFGVALRIREDV